MAEAGFRAIAASTIVFAALALSACGVGTSTGNEKGEASNPTSNAPAEEGFEGKTVSGTGEYKIGTDVPYGGYQLKGEPTSQPDGCTWSIKDADGTAIFENQGSYAFLTDVPENVTFVTNGCPEWEQFE